MANPSPKTAPAVDTLTSAPATNEVADLRAKLAEAQAELADVKANPPAAPVVPMTRWRIGPGGFHSTNTGLMLEGAEVLLPSKTPGPPGWQNLDSGETIPEVPLFTPVQALPAPRALPPSPAAAPPIPVAQPAAGRSSDKSPV